MNELIQAAQQALEALEDVPIEYDFHGNPIDVDLANQIGAAIHSLSQAIDNAEQDNFDRIAALEEAARRVFAESEGQIEELRQTIMLAKARGEVK